MNNSDVFVVGSVVLIDNQKLDAPKISKNHSRRDLAIESYQEPEFDDLIGNVDTQQMGDFLSVIERDDLEDKTVVLNNVIEK